MQLTRFRSDRYVGFVDPRYDGDELRALLAEPDAVCARGAELVGERPGRVVHRLEIDTPRGRQQVYTQKLMNTSAIETLRVPQAYTMLRTSRRMLACGLPTSRAI